MYERDFGGGPDIGRMIDEEVEKAGPPDSRPLKEGEIKDTRTNTERAKSIDRARRERAAEKEIAELRAGWDRKDKKIAELDAKWDAEKQKTFKEDSAKTAAREVKEKEEADMAAEYAAIKELPSGSKEAGEKRAALIGALVKQRTIGNTELGTRFVKLGILYPEDVKLHAYTEMLAEIKKQIIEGRVLDKRMNVFLNGPAAPNEVVQQLQMTVDKEIEAAFTKIIGQLEIKYGRRYEKKPEAKKEQPAKVLPIDAAKEQKTETGPSKKEALGKATEPFFEDVKRMLEKNPPKKKKKGLGGLIDRLTGKKAA